MGAQTQKASRISSSSNRSSAKGLSSALERRLSFPCRPTARRAALSSRVVSVSSLVGPTLRVLMVVAQWEQATESTTTPCLSLFLRAFSLSLFPTLFPEIIIVADWTMAVATRAVSKFAGESRAPFTVSYHSLPPHSPAVSF